MQKYDYLVVGAGLFGATFAYEAAKRGKYVKVIEKRDHIAGNIYTKGRPSHEHDGERRQKRCQRRLWRIRQR